MKQIIERWRARRRQRRKERLEARDQGRRALRNHKPPSGHEGGVPGGWG